MARGSNQLGVRVAKWCYAGSCDFKSSVAIVLFMLRVYYSIIGLGREKNKIELGFLSGKFMGWRNNINYVIFNLSSIIFAQSVSLQ